MYVSFTEDGDDFIFICLFRFQFQKSNLDVEDIVLNFFFDSGVDPYDSECVVGNTELAVQILLFRRGCMV